MIITSGRFSALPVAIDAELRPSPWSAVSACRSHRSRCSLPRIYVYLDRIDRRLERQLEPQGDEASDIERPQSVAAE